MVRLFAGVLLAGMSIPAAAQSETPMTFFAELGAQDRWIAETVQGGVLDIYASGEITEGTADRFVAYVKQHQIEAAKVHFDSPGGNLAEGIKLGRAIRALQFFTTVGVYRPKYDPAANAASICASACAYAFAGGVSRFLDQSTGRLGVHQFYAGEGGTVSGEAAQVVSGAIVSFLDEMGIDAKAFTISTIADRNGMVWLTPDMALRLRFANNGINPPVAEIRLAGMVPYLRVEQDRYNVTTRVLFSCENKTIGMMFGMVTNPEQSRLFVSGMKRSYLELDHKEFLVEPGSGGAAARDSVVWIGRELTPALLGQILRAEVIDGWVDGSGVVRYGAALDVAPVRAKIIEYAKQCYGG